MNNKTTQLIIFTLFSLTPIFFWTLTPNFFTTPKQILFLLSVTTLLLTYSLSIWKNHKLTLPSSKLNLPLILFAFSVIATLIANPEGRPEALAGKGTILLLLPLYTLLLKALLPNSKKIWNILSLGVIISTLVLSVYSLLSLTFLSSQSFIPEFMQLRSFTPNGSYLSVLFLLIVGISISISHLNTIKVHQKPFLLAHLTLSTVTSVAIIALMLPGGTLTPNLIPLQAGWSIALDALKSLRSLLFGIGISNFSLLYTAVKPISLNLTPLWNTLPTTNSSEFLTLLATTGTITTALITFLFFKSLISSLQKPYLATLIIIVIGFFIIPASLTQYLIFFTILAMIDTHEPHLFNFNPKISLAIGIGLTAITIAGITYSLLPYLSEYYIRQAQLGLANNDGKKVYDNNLMALKFGPRISSYHLSFAQTNFNLATALAQKGNLTDQDRQQIAQLVEQSIRYNKNAITLRGNDPSAWRSLALTYQNLINVAQGADKLALTAYTQAISLDRANPTLRTEYGGLLTQLSQIATDSDQSNSYASQAISEYQTAIQLKYNYSNAYYNVAKLLESQGHYKEAITAMQQAIKYLDPNSSDYTQASNELDNLVSAHPATSSSTATEPSEPDKPAEPLATPTPLPSPINGDPIELNQ